MHLSSKRTAPRPQQQVDVETEDLLDLRSVAALLSECKAQSLPLGLVPPLELLALS